MRLTRPFRYKQTSDEQTSLSDTSRQVTSRQADERTSLFRYKEISLSARVLSACQLKGNLLVCSCLVFSCLNCTPNTEDKDKEAIADAAEQFAVSYFNFDVEGSSNYCTPESKIWLTFLASNITQDDIDILNTKSGDATCETVYVEKSTDSTAIALCSVTNFLKIDTLGRRGEVNGEAVYPFNLVKRDGKWLVKMEGLPQSEKKSHGSGRDGI